jgi:hypothetical protein
MICLEILFVTENNRIDKNSVKSEIQNLQINEETKVNVLKAIYNPLPRRVAFDNAELKEVVTLEGAFRQLGIPYRRIEE